MEAIMISSLCLSMIFSEKRFPPIGSRPEGMLFRIILCKIRSKTLQDQGLQERRAMKLFTGWVLSAGLLVAVTSANAQVPGEIGHSRYSAGADGPYAAMPPEGRGAGPSLLPAREVYTVLRDNGFSALGSPRQRGVFYIVSVTDRRGGDGRLVIDARDGQIVRFMRGADRMDANLHDDVMAGVPRPPGSVPQVASRAVPLPKASPQRPDEPKPVAAAPAAAPVQQAAAVETKPAGALTPAPSSAAAVVQAKPEPQILPTQAMPKVQDLE
jgi:hypothetical protein